MLDQQLSFYKQLSRLLTVGDICSELLGSFDGDVSISQAFEQWADLSLASEVNDVDQVGIVEVGGKIQGWIGVHTFDSEATNKDQSLSAHMDLISPSAILTADTPVLEAVKAFEVEHPWFFFVMRSNEIVGKLSCTDFYKVPFRLCLFSLLLSIERSALNLLRLSPHKAIDLLEVNYLRTAKGHYKRHGYKRMENGEEHLYLLLGCTSFADKLRIIRKWESVSRHVPALLDEVRIQTCNDLRNCIAHATEDQRLADLLDRRTLVPFVLWAETLEHQLQHVKVGHVIGANSTQED